MGKHRMMNFATSTTMPSLFFGLLILISECSGHTDLSRSRISHKRDYGDSGDESNRDRHPHSRHQHTMSYAYTKTSSVRGKKTKINCGDSSDDSDCERHSHVMSYAYSTTEKESTIDCGDSGDDGESISQRMSGSYDYAKTGKSAKSKKGCGIVQVRKSGKSIKGGKSNKSDKKSGKKRSGNSPLLSSSSIPSSVPSLSISPSSKVTKPPIGSSSNVPSISSKPSSIPSSVPTSSQSPSSSPSGRPTSSISPSVNPSTLSSLSAKPSKIPSSSAQPSDSASPSNSPSSSMSPSASPSGVPSLSAEPSSIPSFVPSLSVSPSSSPSGAPSSSISPSVNPSFSPSFESVLNLLPSSSPSFSISPSSSPTLAAPLPTYGVGAVTHDWVDGAGVFAPCGKTTTVFGVAICVTPTAWEVSQLKCNHIANVFLQLLDNNADGTADDAKLVRYMVEKQYYMLVPATEDDQIEMPQQGVAQLTGIYEAYPNSCDTPGNRGASNTDRSTWVGAVANTPGDTGCDPNKDATTEEILHLITTAAGELWPDLWAPTKASKAGEASFAMNGNCGWGYLGDYINPSSSSPSCTGLYAYDDATCDLACVVVEGIYWSSVTWMGGLMTTARANDVSNEWQQTVPDASMRDARPSGQANAMTLEEGSPAMYALISDTTSEGHQWLPTSMPDGRYTVTGPNLITTPARPPGTITETQIQGNCCDFDESCALGQVCNLTTGVEVEECSNGYCVTALDGFLVTVGNQMTIGGAFEPQSALPLKNCQGDCDTDDDCAGLLRCFQRDDNESVPGCMAYNAEIGRLGTDYCFDAIGYI